MESIFDEGGEGSNLVTSASTFPLAITVAVVVMGSYLVLRDYGNCITIKEMERQKR